jgi:penicillin-binding protein 1A
MTIGGLTIGVTPLDMAHAYETIAHGGERVTGTLAEAEAPVGIQEVDAGSQPLPDGSRHDVNHVRTKRVLPSSVASTETSMLETVLEYGTGKAAAIGQFAAGKTGTTSNYGDAWFVGWDSKYTVAVWVGYPNKLIPMTTDFNGTPVLGGTFPALIWHEFMVSALQVEKERSELAAEKAAARGHAVTGAGASEVSSTPAPATSPVTSPSAPSKTKGKATTPGATGNEAGEGAGAATPEKATAEPAHEAPSAPAPSTPATPGAPATPTPSPSQTGGVSASP